VTILSVSWIGAACEIERRVQLTRERDEFTLAPKRKGRPTPQAGMEHPDYPRARKKVRWSNTVLSQLHHNTPCTRAFMPASMCSYACLPTPWSWSKLFQIRTTLHYPPTAPSIA